MSQETSQRECLKGAAHGDISGTRGKALLALLCAPGHVAALSESVYLRPFVSLAQFIPREGSPLLSWPGLAKCLSYPAFGG